MSSHRAAIYYFHFFLQYLYQFTFFYLFRQGEVDFTRQGATQRELKEETGLEAEFEQKLVYHKRDFSRETGKLLEDKIFFCVYADRHRGHLIEEFEGGING